MKSRKTEIAFAAAILILMLTSIPAFSQQASGIKTGTFKDATQMFAAPAPASNALPQPAGFGTVIAMAPQAVTPKRVVPAGFDRREDIPATPLLLERRAVPAFCGKEKCSA